MKSLYESILSSTNAGKTGLIRAWLDETDIKNYTINDKWEIDVDGDVNLSLCGLTEFPSYIQFGIVKGDFICIDNKLVSLRGCPRVVKGGFMCSKNKITSLKGAPIEVGEYFSCNDNKLKSLEDAPIKIGGNFNCSHNKLTSLKGAPREVGGNFNCSHNDLSTLDGAPKNVGGFFDCRENKTRFTGDDIKKVCKLKCEINIYV